jgi:hypothetical protein
MLPFSGDEHNVYGPDTGGFLFSGCASLFVEHDLAFDQQPARAAARIVNLHARLGTHDARH